MPRTFHAWPRHPFIIKMSVASVHFVEEKNTTRLSQGSLILRRLRITLSLPLPSDRSVVAFRRSPNLRDLLVTTKLPSNSTNPHTQLPSGSFRCGKNCATCPYISDGLTTYTFFSTNETRHIKSNLTCDTKNLIYMIQCNRCNLQYIGETKRRLKDRFNEHRRTIDNPKSKPTTVAQHFLSSPNHTANAMQLIPIEKVFSDRD